MPTEAQVDQNHRPSTRSERVAIHRRNCQALAAAYAAERGKSPRLIQPEIDALLEAVTMERELWEPNFCAPQFLEQLSPRLRHRCHLA
jgi:hypothetical protein